MQLLESLLKWFQIDFLRNVGIWAQFFGVGPSVDGEHVALDLVAQLSLQVTQLFLEDGQCRHDDVLWPQGAARFHVIKEPVVGKLSMSLIASHRLFFKTNPPQTCAFLSYGLASFLTFPAFHWDRKGPEPHPLQSLSIHSLAWSPQRLIQSLNNMTQLQVFCTFFCNYFSRSWLLSNNKTYSNNLISLMFIRKSHTHTHTHTTPQAVGTLCVSERYLGHTRTTPQLLGSTWRVPSRSLSSRTPWAAVPDLYEVSQPKCLRRGVNKNV